MTSYGNIYGVGKRGEKGRGGRGGYGKGVWDMIHIMVMMGI